jgi:hypothetical protein
MKRRFLHWFNRLFVKYIPSSQQISDLEAKRLAKYIADNYTIAQQKSMLDDMKIELIEHRKIEIQNKRLEIQQNNIQLDRLQNNLVKMMSM